MITSIPGWRSASAVALTAALVALAVTNPASAQGPAQPDEGSRSQTAHFASHEVTLITGDRVTVTNGPSGSQSVTVAPAVGREYVAFVKRKGPDGWSVTPADALALVDAGRLDHRLFHVSTLIKQKRTHMSPLPLIVEYTGDARSAQKRNALAGVDNVRPIRGTAFAALTQRAGSGSTFWKDIAPTEVGTRTLGAGIRRLWLDSTARIPQARTASHSDEPTADKKLKLDLTVAHIGAPSAWARGYNGSGVKVAILDGGYASHHPDLKGVVTETANFTTDPDVEDYNGLGTHRASIIAGSGAASGGLRKGVAPGVELMVGKVCYASGDCPNSGIIEGMEWAAQHGAKVINLSPYDVDTPGQDALEAAVESVSKKYGTLVVAASGFGDTLQSLASPASADAALAVGGTFLDEERIGGSAKGPRIGDWGLKPDIAAPGADVVAAWAGGTGPDDYYIPASGTGVAAPHIAGAAAILFQEHPDWTAQQVKAHLMSTTVGGVEAGAYWQGAGRVDVARASAQAVSAEPTGLDFKRVRWSSAGRPPVTKTLTYRNPGSEPVTLDLSVKATYDKTVPAPDGLFRLSADTVTVPAHGSQSVTLTGTPEAAGTHYEAFSGVVQAVSPDGAVSVRTALGMDVEEPFYDLSLKVIGRTGHAPTSAAIAVDALDSTQAAVYPVEIAPDGTGKVRVPHGTWSISGLLFDSPSDDPARTQTTVVAVPRLAMLDDRTVTFDARKARKATTTAPRSSLRITRASVGTISKGLNLGAEVPGAIGRTHLDNIYALPTEKTSYTGFAYALATNWETPSDRTRTPVTYHLTRSVVGAIPDVPGFSPRTSDLAKVDTTFTAARAGTTATRVLDTYVAGQHWATDKIESVPVPSQRTDYFSVSDGLEWQPGFDQSPGVGGDGTQVPGQLYIGERRSYRARTSTDERWNGAVQSFGLKPNELGNERDGDTMRFSLQPGANGNLDTFAGSETGLLEGQLQRNGEVISDHPFTFRFATVPDDATPADYLLTASYDRDPSLSDISASTRAEWRFRSASSEQPQSLPLYAVRMAPELDEWNRARAGSKLDIPTYIQRETGTPETAIRTFTVDVSYNEGKTWQRAQVKGSGLHRTVKISHPKHSKGGSVSLRSFVEDAAGNSFKQTVLKAYLIK
ncbi:S8 family serine peptidase [Actinacidiphila glaucinigra]|uniref:S8 family serine peptidase n=1 Tax=Actinacidiphila glaucinigra TaxID=235986 RepID=UPI0033AEAE8D